MDAVRLVGPKAPQTKRGTPVSLQTYTIFGKECE